MSAEPLVELGSATDADLYVDIQQFVGREVQLLDSRRFEEWLKLFTDDIRYWMPVVSTTEDRAEAVAGPSGLAWFDEDHASLALRVQRLGSPQAHAEHPASRTRRFVMVTSFERIDVNEVLVAANFAIHRTRRERDVDMFVGIRHDVLRWNESGWRIAARTLVLDQDIVANRDLSIFF